MIHYYPEPIPITVEMEKRIERNSRRNAEQDNPFWFEREHNKEVSK